MKNEKHDEKLEWVAASAFLDVYLEAMEKAQNTCEKLEESGSAGIVGLPVGIRAKDIGRLLE